MNYPGFDRGISTGPTIGVDVNSSPQKVKRMTSSRFAKGAVAAALVAAIATNAAPISTGYTVPPQTWAKGPCLAQPKGALLRSSPTHLSRHRKNTSHTFP